MAEERGYYQLEEQPAFKEQVERLLNSDEVRAEGSQFESLLLSMLNNIKAAYQKAGSVADGVGKPGGAASLDETGKVPANQIPDLSGQYEALYPLQILSDGTDLNTIKTPGTYGGDTSKLVNAPKDSGQCLLVVRRNGGAQIWQEFYYFSGTDPSKFYRDYTSSTTDTWTPWQEEFTPVWDYYGMDSGVDIDNITDDYMLVSSAISKDCPVGGSFVFIMQFFYGEILNSNLRIQIAYGVPGGTSAPSSAYGMAIRRYSNSTWGEWEEIYTTRVKPTAADVGAIANPAGGTAGQVLTKTDGGAAWGDAPQTGITQEQADARYLQLSGGTVTGPLKVDTNESYDGLEISVDEGARITFTVKGEGNLKAFMGYDPGGISDGFQFSKGIEAPYCNATNMTVSSVANQDDAVPNKAYIDQQVAAAGGVVTGTYTGNGDETSGYTVNLGFKPKAVIIWATDGTSGGNGNIPFSDGGIILDTQPIQSGSTIHAEIVNEGFKVYTVESNNRPSYNYSKLQHTYIAFK